MVQEVGRLGIKIGHSSGYHPCAFLKEEMAHALAVADLVVSRAGANAISEIAANGKPSIIIPIKSSANNHQELNAYALLESGAAIVLNQDNLGENILLEKIEEVLNSGELQYELGE
ncbi:MAG: glycosyltransferase, partial [Candidatus Moranbacteria bacterium]|nr:glycosyltransferase [Candidatus Moranbacteria bacterium]